MRKLPRGFRKLTVRYEKNFLRKILQKKDKETNDFRVH